MDAAPVELIEVFPRKKRLYWHVFEPFDQFVKPWWDPSTSPSESEHWLSVRQDGVEVARCKFDLHRGARFHPILGDMPHGQLDILAVEVAASVRRQGIGRGTLRAIRSAYPWPRLTALNDDEQSRGFWDRLGWIRHDSPHSLLRSERVTYSEM